LTTRKGFFIVRVMKFRFFTREQSDSGKDTQKNLSKFVKNQFRELAKKNLSIPVRLYTL
jgi:hypothetical protein